jgi:hypothetical protein
MLDIRSQKLGRKSLDDVLDILSDVVGILLRMRTILMCSFVESVRFPQVPKFATLLRARHVPEVDSSLECGTWRCEELCT